MTHTDVETVSADRQRDDYYHTPPEATRAFLAAAGPLIEGRRIWECAVGEGHMADVLSAEGYDVVCTDLVDRGYLHATPRVDFLMETRLLAPVVMTNPPFKLWRQFHAHAALLGAHQIVFYGKLAWLTSKGRHAWWPTSKLRSVFIQSDRPQGARNGNDIGGGGSSKMLTAWYFWQANWTAKPTVEWIMCDEGA